MKKWLWILSFICINAHAENWHAIGGSDKAELSMDVDSIQVEKNLRQAWSMWNFKEARPNNGDPTFPFLKSYKDMHLYNCKDKTLKLSREIIYAENDGKGAQRDHSDALKNQKYIKPADGSVAAAMVELVCGYVIPK